MTCSEMMFKISQDIRQNGS